MIGALMSRPHSALTSRTTPGAVQPVAQSLWFAPLESLPPNPNGCSRPGVTQSSSVA